MIDLGRLTDDQTAELVSDALALLPEDRAIAVVVAWAIEDEAISDELIAAIEAAGGAA